MPSLALIKSCCELVALAATLTVLAGACAYGAERPEARDPRLVFMALTPAQGQPDISAALKVALDAGAHGPGDINLSWGNLEPAAGRFVDPDGVMAWARDHLSAGPGVSLTLAPIQTSVVTVPPDLEGRPWDDPVLIARFIAAMEFVAKQLEGVPIITVAIGNEADTVLGADTQAWAAYQTFYKAVADCARSLWPGADVGVKLVAEAFFGDRADQCKALAQASDALLVTVYPKTQPADKLPATLRENVDALTRIAPGKPVHVVEIGYPSSPALGSSEQDQADFVTAAFAAWDAYATAIPSMCFVWLHDLPRETIESMARYYGMEDKNFIAWLGSLGLKKSDGMAKPAFERFKKEVEARW